MKLADLEPRIIYGKCGAGEPEYANDEERIRKKKDKYYRYKLKLAQLLRGESVDKRRKDNAPII